MFHLTLTLLPASVLKVAELIGYGGDRERAFEYLRQSQESSSFMAPFSCLLLLSYYLTISAFTGQEDPSFLPESRKLLDVSSDSSSDAAQPGAAASDCCFSCCCLLRSGQPSATLAARSSLCLRAATTAR